MEGILQPPVVQVVGVVILLAAFAQAGISAIAAFRRSQALRQQHEDSIARLRYQAATSLASLRDTEERTQHGWNGIRKFEVAEKIPEADGVHSFYLKPHDGKPLPPFSPGQYLTFMLRIPDADKQVVRCYSLSDSPGKNYYRVSIKKVPPPRDKPDAPPGMSSTYFNDQLNVEDILDVKAPSGHFYLDTTRNSPIVLIGGGIGITPVLSMLNAVCESDIEREVWFFLGVRNSREQVQKAHVEALAAEHANVNICICYSDPLEDDVEGRDYQHQGWVGVDLFKQVLPSNNFEFYICGPPPLMNSVTEGLAEWGVPSDAVNFEAFGPASVKKTAPSSDDGKSAETGEKPECMVKFARSQKSVTWDGSHESLLELAEANDVVIDFGCRAGNCGTCITALKSGEVTYLNEPGAPPEEGSCLTCISVPKGDVVVDA